MAYCRVAGGISARSPRAVFVGRERELARFTALLDSARAASGGIAIASGEPGIGKTRLLQEVARLAKDGGFGVHWGRTFEPEASAAYWPWIRILRSVVGEAGEEQLRPTLGTHARRLARLLPELQRLASTNAVDESDPRETERLALYEAAFDVLVAAARERPLLLVLDDVHVADHASLMLLQFLGGEVGNAPIAIAVTYRKAEVTAGDPLASTLRALARAPQFLSIELRGLAHGEVGELVAAAGGPPHAETIGTLLERTGGNPFFLTQLLDLDATERPEVPSSVRAAVQERLARLSRECSELLAVAAFAGSSFTLDVFAALTGTPATAIERALEEAVLAGILDVGDTAGSYRFHHALVQEALAAPLSPARRTEVHAQTARALEALYWDAPERAAEIAYHFERAASQPECAAAAVRYLRRAAEHARGQYAWEEAVRHYEACVALIDSAGGALGELDVDLLIALGQCHASTANPVKANPIALRALEMLRYHPDAERLVTLFSLFNMWYPPREPELEVIQRTVDSLSTTNARIPVAILHRGLLRSETRAEADDWIRKIKSLVDESTLPEWAALQVEADVAFRFDDDLDRAIALRRRAWESVDPRRDVTRASRLLSIFSHIATSRGDADEMLAIANEIERFCDEFRVYGPLVGAYNMRSLVAMGRGELSRFAEGAPDERFHSFPHQLFVLAMMQRRLDDARRLLAERFFDGAQGWRDGDLAWLEAEEGNMARARDHWADFIAGSKHRLQADEIGMICTFAQPALIEVIDEQSCERILTRMLSTHCHAGCHSHDVGRGLAALKLGRVDDAERHFQRGLEWAAAQRFILNEGRSLHGLAEVAARRGLRAKALEYIDLATTRFEQWGAGLYLRHAREFKEGLGKKAEGGGSDCQLSRRELAVLRLMVAGRTNREIAEALVVTHATAATHVRHVLEKTGTVSRAEAAAWAVRNGLA